MNQSGANSENGDQQELAAHEEFLELCALSTSGALTGKEQGKLDCHLALCPECSAALRDYQKVVGIGIPSLAPELISDSVAASASASVESAKRRLFEAISIEMEGQSEASPILDASVFAGHQPGVVGRNVAANRTWRPQRLLRYAAALILMIGMAGASYRLGEHRAAVRSSSSEQQPARAPSGLQQEVSALTQEREVLDSELRRREQTGTRLTGELTEQREEIAKLKREEQTLREAVVKSDEQNIQLTSEHDAVNQQLAAARANLTKIQADLDALRQKGDRDLLRATNLEARISELSESLKDREDTIAQQQQLLASDRDIRDLMGARDLYIVEVYDVARNGEMKKPFGRVFLTKNKSLIFYAYDLQRQPGVTDASTFQAWGSRGPDRKGAVSLGVFYMDNTANKRWVVKVDDPKTLQQIDAVFVTVEPNGGSVRPSGKQLLFAYLKVDANHP
jgi:hypothetical protein